MYVNEANRNGKDRGKKESICKENNVWCFFFFLIRKGMKDIFC